MCCRATGQGGGDDVKKGERYRSLPVFLNGYKDKHMQEVHEICSRISDSVDFSLLSKSV